MNKKYKIAGFLILSLFACVFVQNVIAATVPMQVEPANGETIASSSVTLEWTTGSGTSWPLQIQTSSGSSVYTGTITGSTQYTRTGLSNGTYQWRVASSAGVGCVSDYSGWRTFMISEPCPSAPTTSSPSGTIADTTPLFSWSNEANTDQYRLHCENADTGDDEVYMLVQTNSYQKTGAMSPGNYRWRVASLKSGCSDAWSAWRTFTISEPCPSTPTTNSPSGTITDTTPLFTWSSVSNVDQYRIQVQDTATGTDEVYALVQTNSYQKTGAMSPGNYRWRVASLKSGCSDAWSSWVTFTINLCSATVPSQQSPTSGATIDISSVVLNWSDGGATSWSLQIQTSSGTSVYDSTVTGSSQYTVTGLSNDTYQWRVSAIESGGCETPFSSWRVFHILLVTPSQNDPDQSMITLPEDGQLRDLTGNGLNANLQTVVITHGWNLTGSTNTPDWIEEMAQAIINQGVNANIIWWDWLEVATSSTPASWGPAASDAPRQGRALSETLFSLLGSNYDQPIHFIGYSLGTRVVKHAVDDLHNNGWNPNNTHVTILDGAEFGDLDANLWDKCIPEQAEWIDNYVSAFGDIHPEAANVILLQGKISYPEPSMVGTIERLESYHAYAVQWYIDTISNPLDSAMGFRWSFENGGIIGAPPLGSVYAQTVNPWSPLELYHISWSDAENIIDIRNLTLVSEYVLLTLVIIHQGPLEAVGQVSIDISEEILGGIIQYAINLIFEESSPAYVWIPVTIPSYAEYMSFDIIVNQEGDGDYISVGIENELLFIQEIEYAENQGPVNSGFLNISQYAGDDVELFIGLNDVGSVNAQVTIENIKFHYSNTAANAGGSGGGGGGSSGGGCFMATAAYGSYLDPQVKILREFRDQILLKSSIGKDIIEGYYTHSSPLVEFISKYEFARFVTRSILLPVIGYSWMALKIGFIPATVLMALLLIIMTFCSYILAQKVRLRYFKI